MSVARIFEKRISVRYNEYGINPIEIKDVSPIPLTKELLLKCGFEYHAKTPRVKQVYFTHKQSGFILRLDDADCYDVADHFDDNDGMGYEIVSFSFSGTIKYLHRLQNLYLALIGEELQIDPTALTPWRQSVARNRKANRYERE